MTTCKIFQDIIRMFENIERSRSSLIILRVSGLLFDTPFCSKCFFILWWSDDSRPTSRIIFTVNSSLG